MEPFSLFEFSICSPMLIVLLLADEVRRLGIELGIEPASVWRHPFPGPGLAIRIIGEVTKERTDILRAADYIFLEEIKASGDYSKVGQAFVVLMPDCRTVGVMGDCRTYGMVKTVSCSYIYSNAQLRYMTRCCQIFDHDIWDILNIVFSDLLPSRY